jgi:hypothetical protein
MMKYVAIVAAAILTTAPNPANAQVYYTINGQAAPANIAYSMAAMGMPPGNYWLAQNGNRGVVGSAYPLGNIYANSGGASPGYSAGPQTRCRTWGTGEMRCD